MARTRRTFGWVLAIPLGIVGSFTLADVDQQGKAQQNPPRVQQQPAQQQKTPF